MKVLLVHNERRALALSRQLGYSYFPDFDGTPFSENSPAVRMRRLRVLEGVLSGKVGQIVCTLTAISRYTLSPALLKEKIFRLKKGETFNIAPDTLIELGYSRVDTVREFGEFAIRGDIVDIYTFFHDLPVRIELLDETVESIRLFDPNTQRSVKEIEEVCIGPAREYVSVDHSFDTVPKDAGSDSTFFDFLKDPEFFSPDFDRVVKEHEKKLKELQQLSADLWEKYVGSSLVRTEEVLRKLGTVKKVEIEETKVHVLEEEEVEGAPLIDVDDLEVGDIVVHKDYGIGRFEGIERIKSVLGEKDFIKLKYADAILYVPVDRLGRLHKYIGSDSVRIDSLKGSRWRSRVRSAKKEIERRVKELVKLYAKRSMVKGLSLPGDPSMEEEFARSFPYMETADQLRAIEAVLEDLTSEKPMDRLISGDSGYGKTEVALRATFRAVVSGKQVAVLAPTVVLANQHYRTFQERLQPFGIKVEILDSTKRGRERIRIKEDLASGKIDVIIGTHSILADDVKFADLGLVIIDEEQKFGVEQKEKLKKLRLSVNVLSMSATPIPRTLHMALSGMKDISTINTPPIGRKPVTVYVAPMSDSIIKSAVLRELTRGGQVIYVHNRVEEIPRVLERLKRLLPEVSIAVAHGRMNKKKLEKTVEAFAKGEIDLLLCTTVIESGIDIGTANTIIVDDAHRYGLAQLYQLRGRVGRRRVKGYAYFLYPPDASKEALKRLEVIKTHTGPGSGLEIALRDLEMRGYGDVLGIQQSGHIESIGYRYYVEILRETIGKFKGEEIEEFDVEIVGFPGDVMLPEDYVPDPMERLRIYRRVSKASSFEEVDQIKEELRDRFGRLPYPAENLLHLATFKVALHRIGVSKIEIAKGSCVLKFRKKPPENFLSGIKHLFNPRKNVVIVLERFEDLERKIFEYLEKGGLR